MTITRYTLATATGGGSYTDEQARDAVAAALTAGTNIAITPNDGADTITVAVTGMPTQYTDEQARDAIGAALVAGSNISVTVDDAGNTITVAATGLYTDEQAQDAVAAALAAGTHTGAVVAYNDGANSLSITATGDLPEFATSAQTAVVGTPANMVGKITRYDTTSGAIAQTLPAATAGRVFAIGWDAGTNALTLTAAGSDVIGSGATTTVTVPLVGEVLTYHCTTAGRWRVVGGFKTTASLDARYAPAGMPALVANLVFGS